MLHLKVATLSLAVFFAVEADAFAVGPAIDAPVAAANQMSVVSSATVATGTVQISPSNLPSQFELLGKVGSFTLANAAPPKATNVASGSGIGIADIHYDGIVPKTEADEYIVISNSSRDNVDVSGYFIYPATTGTQGSTFYFPQGSVIKGGSSIRVYTNEIHKESGGYSFGSGKALWSNNGGLAVLKDASGKKLAEFKYKPAKVA